MATFNLFFIPESQLSVTNGTASGSQDPFPDNDVGNSLANNPAPASFTISGTPENLSVSDDDNDVFNDEGTTLLSNQTLAAPIAGYPAGSVVELLYSYQVTGSDGSSATIYAVAAGPNYLGDDFIGLVSSAPLKQGVTYTIGNLDEVVDPTYASLAPFCFARGTLILTDQCQIAVEDLSPGDLVVTRDNGLQPIRWIGSRRLTGSELGAQENLRPIRISAGALGTGIPERDLLVSPQHRILVQSRIAHRIFGTDEILAAAKQLCALDGIDIATDLPNVRYFHLLFDRHEVVTANGAAAESLFTGPEALKSVGPAARREILSLFPELALRDYSPVAARLIANGRQARRLVQRHAQNHKPLVMA